MLKDPWALNPYTRPQAPTLPPPETDRPEGSVAIPLAVAAGTTLAGLYGANQNADAQGEANLINLQIAREQAAEQARQFDTTTGIQQNQFGYQAGLGENQFGYQAGLGENRYGYEQQALNERNLDMQQRFDLMRGQNIGRIDPYSQAGQAASQERSALLGLSGAGAQDAAMGRFTEGAGQKFLRERQEKALLRSGSKIGALGGGNIRTALQEQAFNIAQTDFDNYMGKLSGVAGQGLQAGGMAIQAGYGPQVGVSSTDYDPYGAYTPTEGQEFVGGTDIPGSGTGGEVWVNGVDVSRPPTTVDFLRDPGGTIDEVRGALPETSSDIPIVGPIVEGVQDFADDPTGYVTGGVRDISSTVLNPTNWSW